MEYRDEEEGRDRCLLLAPAGDIILQSGAEIFRVETTMSHMAKALHVEVGNLCDRKRHFRRQKVRGRSCMPTSRAWRRAIRIWGRSKQSMSCHAIWSSMPIHLKMWEKRLEEIEKYRGISPVCADQCLWYGSWLLLLCLWRQLP